MRVMRSAATLLAIALAVAGCGGGDTPRAARDGVPGRESFDYPPPPVAPAGPVAPDVSAAMRVAIRALASGRLGAEQLAPIVASRDPRVAWFVSDLMRFAQGGPAEQDALVAAFRALTGADPTPDPRFAASPWQSITDHLIAWDLPAAPGYRTVKGELFTLVEPGWRPFFADADADIDWRFVSWGGVLIDDRPLGSTEACPRGCIPALDDPALTDASAGGWYPDDATVFGVVVGGDAVALPKNMMEVHEMVNMTIGGRRLGIPYCTLCASAQAYVTGTRNGPPLVLRTSGLLTRSNKVMYELTTRSVFDTFTGRAVSGPLRRKGTVLPQVTVVTSAWGAWKAAHPNTRIVARDGGIGRDYPTDPLGGRDDGGPIFPIGDVDPRLPAQEAVLGAIGPAGPVAFPVAVARAELVAGRSVAARGVEVFADGGGLRARGTDGKAIVTHQAFWFAWSQFNPGTALWEP